MLGGELAVLQAPIFDGLSFDPFALFDDGFGPARVGVGWCHVVEALVIAPVVILPIRRQSGCDERVNQDEKTRLDFAMIVAIFGFCNA